jgi:hypothetical protein
MTVTSKKRYGRINVMEDPDIRCANIIKMDHGE